ncbi:hypothetical protein GDO78_000723 [Eleutherodactylus coqui]|uniref:Uncharacterized protein n=1 Tax=Eleutherodactylus coqui TaxID=57060 RepID=A0A8J6FSW0_ELECQ|nr:hypothetical protein GDO78_000723 [Eleutherodactylus coqui]
MVVLSVRSPFFLPSSSSFFPFPFCSPSPLFFPAFFLLLSIFIFSPLPLSFLPPFPFPPSASSSFFLLYCSYSSSLELYGCLCPAFAALC